MESWNRVVNASLLGTEKRSLKAEELTTDFTEVVAAIAQQTEDKEDIFLQTAALVYSYRQCGFVPLNKAAVAISKAETETKEYASSFAHAVLRDVIETGSISLLSYWLEACNKVNKIVLPEAVPLLLTVGAKTKTLQPLVIDCCGKRGAWLQQFNDEWQWHGEDNCEDVWQTGTPTQRKAFLQNLRQTDPEKALELLQQTWQQESAATKVELLQSIAINASSEDVAWLEGLSAEKSVKVKEAALGILKEIPSSSIVQQYWNILKQSIKLITSEGLLGIGTKTSLEIKLTAFDDSLFKTGIQQLPSQANISDEQFILYQLIGFVPPQFWEDNFNMDKDKIVDLFSKDKYCQSFIPSFGLAASRFKNLDWLRKLISLNENRMYADAFTLLPQREAEEYALRFLSADDGAASVLHTIHVFSKEWSTEFAKAVLRYTAKNPYQFHRGFYNDIAALLPVPVVGELEKATPKDEYFRNLWSTQSEHLTKLLTLKLQTLKAFNRNGATTD